MTMPATSVPSKRTFKISEILSDKKMSITPENLERRILIELNQAQQSKLY